MVYLLLIYFIFLLLFAVYSIIGIYHLWRFGYVGDLTKPAIVLYLIFSLAIIALTFLLIFSRPWPVDFSI